MPSLLQRALATFRSGRGVRTYAVVVLGFMVLVILEGAVVRATGSGAGCGNHWPLCNGEVLPHHPRLATIIEFTHRSLTGICSTLFIGLLAWVFLARSKGDSARRAAAWTGFFLVTEALLGAVLVNGGYVENNTTNARVLVQCVHFTNTMLLLAMLTLTWWTLRPRIAKPAQRTSSLSLIWLALVSTMIVGATGSVAALADTLFPSTTLHAALAADLSTAAPLLIHMRVLHPLSAAIAFACVGWLCTRMRTSRSNLVLLLLVGQGVLGLADVLLLAPLWLQVLHLFAADLYWIALVTFSAEALGTNSTRLKAASALVLAA